MEKAVKVELVPRVGLAAVISPAAEAVNRGAGTAAGSPAEAAVTEAVGTRNVLIRIVQSGSNRIGFFCSSNPVSSAA